ncbi:MFS transporter [Nocardioides gansuensis]|uniref:MFS transporter n=1 Tax=Nocardioides gansuensis TaxID=2138300 RepID=A0A2T8F7F8_9ACTN|nr:MFS transporter [Nocardioides gansuensis]PVG81651.1 MFS transporter [Nocardioides gansuensis]
MSSVRQADRNSMRRVATAGCIGTTIEYYDFFIYGTAAALVFPTVFFPALGSTAGTVASFATFAVAFVARPLGAIIFGHFGDVLGRKGTLITTLLLMGSATVAVGLLPSADSIGVVAPICLVVLRFAQGLAVGGEWAGANLLTAEYAPAGRRGFYAVFPQLGGSLGFALSSATFLATDKIIGNSDEAFLSYGWRIPFIASAVLVLIGLWVRGTIDETPVFRAEQEATRSTKRTSPFAGVLRDQWREVLLSAGLMGVQFALFYVGAAYLTSYGTAVAGIERGTVLAMGIVAALVAACFVFLGGKLSDRYGRRRIIMGTSAAAGVWAFVMFPLVDTGSGFAFGVALAGTLALYGLAYGPVGAFLPELFATRYRYTGAGTGYNLGGIIGAAIPPLLAPVLADAMGGVAVGAMLAILALVSVACTWALAETSSRRTLRDEDLLEMPSSSGLGNGITKPAV